MSNMNNNNNNNNQQPPPPQQQYNNRRGGGYGGNQYRSNQYGGNQNRNWYGNNQNGNFIRRNTYYNRNYQQRYNNNNNGYGRNYDNGGYGFVSGPPPPQGRFNGNQRRQSRSGSRQRYGPRPMRLNDFMPPQLRGVSPNAPNLPQDFNLADDGTAATTPVDALPQRPNFATQTITRTNNTTQPFNPIPNQNNQNQQPQQQQQQPENNNPQGTTASYRRRQRRNRQEQYRNMGYDNNNNRFAPMADDAPTDMESNYGEDTNDYVPPRNNNTNKKETKEGKSKKKQRRLYLESNRTLRYMQDNSSATISGRGNQAYVLATTAIYDDWVRNNYELQVWQTYLKMGTENKHWAKEVIQRTKKRDDVTNIRFIRKKMNRLTDEIAQASATIADLQIQLGTYWAQTLAGTGSTSTESTMTTTTNRSPDPIDRLEKSILAYIQHCTQHVKKSAETRIKLAKAQMDEFKALEDFEQVATPAQWNIHLTLKPKMKLWSTKNKNYRTAMKRVEHDLPPKFIAKTDLSFKIDESIVN